MVLFIRNLIKTFHNNMTMNLIVCYATMRRSQTICGCRLGRLLALGATCVDIFAPSYLPSTEGCADVVAATAETLNQHKFINLIGNYNFESFGV